MDWKSGLGDANERVGTLVALLECQMRRISQLVDAKLPLLLTRDDAATQLSISPSTLKKLIRDGDVQVTTLGKRQMVARSELERVSSPSPAKARGKPAGKRQKAETPKEQAEELRAALKAKKAR